MSQHCRLSYDGSLFELRTKMVQAIEGAINTKLLEDCWMDIAQTQQIRGRIDQMRNGHPPMAKFFVPREQRYLLQTTLLSMGHEINKIDGVLLHCFDHLIGAIRLPLRFGMFHSFEIWNIVREDLIIVTQDVAFGILLEVNFFDYNCSSISEGIYECSIWGSEYMFSRDSKEIPQIDLLGRAPLL